MERASLLLRMSVGVFTTVLVCGVLYVFAEQARSVPLSYDASFEEQVAHWSREIKHVGAEAAKQTWSRWVVAGGSEVSFRDEHLLYHAFGEALYRTLGVGGFAFCGLDHGDGCTHQFLIAAFAHQGEESLHDLYSVCIESGERPSNLCLHSLGHALMYQYGYSPLGRDRALAACTELLPGTDPIYGCADGALMEYYLRTAEGAEDPMPVGTDYAQICDGLAGAHLLSCAQRLPKWWLWVDMDESNVANLHTLSVRCSDAMRALGAAWPLCFYSLGDLAADALSHSEASQFCSTATPGTVEQLWCRRGVEYRRDTTHVIPNGEAVCETGTINQARCVEALRGVTQLLN